MCLGDWRLGKLIRATTFTGSIASNGTLTINADPCRVGIHFGGNSVNQPSAGLVQFAVDGVFFAQPDQAQLSETITLANHGDLPTRQWTITNKTGATYTYSYTTLILPEDYIRQAMDQLKSEYKL